MAEKFAALTFQSIEDFEICNKYMKAKRDDIGLCTNKSTPFTKRENLENSCFSDGKLCVIVKTKNLLIPPGTLIVKTKQGNFWCWNQNCRCRRWNNNTSMNAFNVLHRLSLLKSSI